MDYVSTRGLAPAQRYTDILLMLGTAKGIILAEGALHEKEFCEGPNAAKAAADVNDFWK